MNPTVTELHRIAEELENKLIEKGYVKQHIEFQIEAFRNISPFSVIIRYAKSDYGEAKCKVYCEGSFDDAVIKVEGYIDDLPTPEDLDRQDFIRETGQLLDRAKKLGLETVPSAGGAGEINYVAWLEDMMKSLSENVITHQRTTD